MRMNMRNEFTSFLLQLGLLLAQLLLARLLLVQLLLVLVLQQLQVLLAQLELLLFCHKRPKLLQTTMRSK